MDALEKAQFDQARAIIKKYDVPVCLTMLLGNCIGHLANCGLKHHEIEHILAFLADGTEKIRNDPKVLESIKSMFGAVHQAL